MEEKKIEESVQEILISLLKEGKSVWAQTQGKSMYPLIREGDFVKIKPMKISEVGGGDVIAFLNNKAGETIIAHRLVRRNKDILITRGDNHIFVIDPPLVEKSLLGKVVAIKRNGKVKSLERGFPEYYAKLIYYLNHYGYPLLVFLLSVKKLIIEPRIFFAKMLQHMQRFIKTG